MDEELKAIADYFESWELAEFLGITASDFIAAFEEQVLDKLDELEDLMEFHR